MTAISLANYDAIIPVGALILWINSIPPNNRYLAAKGGTFNVTQYPLLASIYPLGVLPSMANGPSGFIYMIRAI